MNDRREKEKKRHKWKAYERINYLRGESIKFSKEGKVIFVVELIIDEVQCADFVISWGIFYSTKPSGIAIFS